MTQYNGHIIKSNAVVSEKKDTQCTTKRQETFTPQYYIAVTLLRLLNLKNAYYGSKFSNHKINAYYNSNHKCLLL